MRLATLNVHCLHCDEAELISILSPLSLDVLCLQEAHQPSHVAPFAAKLGMASKVSRLADYALYNCILVRDGGPEVISVTRIDLPGGTKKQRKTGAL